MASRAQSRSSWPLKADWLLKGDWQRKVGQFLTADQHLSAEEQQKADWSAYAAAYDLLLAHNPAYQQLLGEFKAAMSKEDTPQVIYDIGGGTGNYAQMAAEMYPESSVYFVEPDEGMSVRAKGKMSERDNVVYIDSALQDVEAPEKADLVICVHALYTMPEPQDRLADLRKLLKPGGLLFLIDLGRLMNVSDWRSYLFSHLTKEVGIARALQIFWQGREIAKQNQAIFKAQQENLYWTHSASEISSAVKKAGFDIQSQKTVYRGYSDLLLCRAAE